MGANVDTGCSYVRMYVSSTWFISFFILLALSSTQLTDEMYVIMEPSLSVYLNGVYVVWMGH